MLYSIGESASVTSSLTKNLSKKDTVRLLEIASHAINGNIRDDYKAIVTELKNLIPVEGVMGISVFAANGKELDKIKLDYINFGFPDEFPETYSARKYQFVDPCFKELLKTFGFVDNQLIAKRGLTKQEKAVYLFVRECGLRFGFMYGIRTSDFKKAMLFSFHAHSSNSINQRLKVIIESIVPFMSVLLQKIINPIESNNKYQLTIRETEILQWLKEGKSSWEISMILNIGESTVNFHVTNIMRKLNATRRTQAVAIALSQGLIEL
jgi:DNA-binding CsgD family transcriptional regulator